MFRFPMGTSLKTSFLGDSISRNIPIVRDIVESLAQQSPRFEYIKESLDEFLHDNAEFLELEARVSTLNPRRAASAPDDGSTMEMDHKGSQSNYEQILSRTSAEFIDILNTAIYELMDVFNVEITLEQIKEAGYKLPEARITIFKALHEVSQELSPQPEKLMPVENPASIPNNECDYYQYPNRLISSNVRVLHILPGHGESIVECELEERSLDNEGIEEALSYVWGEPVFDKIIQLGGRSFRVTKNLYNILCNLRRRDATRVIWIDAICINQSDLEEKTHQVRLMGDIYSKAQKTVIWLDSQPPEQNRWEGVFGTDEINSVLKFTHQVGRYNLATILNEILKCEANDHWDGKRLELSILLIFCMGAIMADEWWERAWTIQEVTLPPNDPMIYFQSCSFPYTTLISSLDTISDIPQDAWRNLWRVSFMHPKTLTIFDWKMRQINHAIGSWRSKISLIRLLRSKNHEDRSLMSLPRILESASGHRSRDPRDKIFAISSLLARSAGKLVNVNYNQPKGSLFRRITARCLNLRDRTTGSSYPFITESSDGCSGPSWVRNFGHVHLRNPDVHTGCTTLSQYLCISTNHYPFLRIHAVDHSVIQFTTPKTLYCPGLQVGMVYHTVMVGDLRRIYPGYDEFIQFLVGFDQDNFQEWPLPGVTNGSVEKQEDSTATENPTTKDENTSLSVNLESEKSGIEGWMASQRQMLKLQRLRALVRILTLDTRSARHIEPPLNPQQGRKEFVMARLEAVDSAYLFATTNGIVGLATAPVQKGDTLAILLPHRNYIVLREKEHGGDGTGHGEKHQIVARAAITESPDELGERVDKGPPIRQFQIV